MSTTYVVATVLTALWVGFSAASVFARAKWVVEPLSEYGVPRRWWPWLGTAKAAGAAGLLVDLFVPVIGILAGTGLVLYFIGAVNFWRLRPAATSTPSWSCSLQT